MLDFEKYRNNHEYADFKTNPAQFDAWANRNDYIAQEFTNDLTNLLIVKLSANDNLIKKIETIVDMSYNYCDSFEQRYEFCLELIELLVWQYLKTCYNYHNNLKNNLGVLKWAI